MPELTSLIVDDEPIARSIIESYIDQLSNWAKPVSCKSALEALDKLNAGMKPDVIFLDINMPVLSGVDFFKSLKDPPLVVFTTAYSEFAIEAFELNAADYLVKPISFTRFLKTAQRIQNHFSPEKEIAVSKTSKRDFIFVKHNGKMQRIDFASILFAEAKGDYIDINTGSNHYLVLMSMKELEEWIPSEDFRRVHRSFIVNLRHINATHGNVIELEGKEVPIGTSYKEDFLKAITDRNSDFIG
jgi:DNA-binding LytR/AlgR family response regulator